MDFKLASKYRPTGDQPAAIRELTAGLELPATYEKPGRAVEINRQLTGVTDALARVVPEWEAAVARLNDLPAKTA